jgi:hypothetical protein
VSATWLDALPGHDGNSPLLACRELVGGSGGELWQVSTHLASFVLKRRVRRDPEIDLDRMRTLRQWAADAGFAAPLRWMDPQGCVELGDWIPGATLPLHDLQESAGLLRVAQRVGELHRCALPDAWRNRIDWQFDMRAHLDRRRARLRLPPCDWPAGAEGSRSPRPNAVVHLDLHAGNIVVADRLMFLDWDYAALGDPLWDLASLLAPLDVPPGLHAGVLQAAGRERDTSVDELRVAIEAFRELNRLWAVEQPPRSAN